MVLKIIYTSDVHGQITASNYALNKKDNHGLTRLSTYIKKISDDFLLLDNGDFLQGNVLLDYYLKHKKNMMHPMVKAFNLLKYDFVNLGNHDFNYGQTYLKTTLKELNAEPLCANITDILNETLYKPYAIKTLTNGIRIGIIGAVTQYIPHWEKPSHIEGLTFKDAYESTLYFADKIRKDVDYLIVLYHGGFEKDLESGTPIGRDTSENLGYKLAQIDAVDLLLCGHQHMPTNHVTKDNTIVLQTAANVKNFGEVTINFDELGFTHKAKLINNTFDEDPSFSTHFETLEKETQNWLDQPAGKLNESMVITNQIEARKTKHPLFELINKVQFELTNADISVASLPNDAIGFNKTIYLRDIAANFVYPNTLVVLKMSGKKIKAAIERTAEYFAIKDNDITIDDSFAFPKVEHYNYDIFDGINYTLDISKPKGQRLVEITYKGQPLQDDHHLTVALNNYRAQGGGDYPMYEDAEVVAEYTDTLFDLVKDYIEKHPTISSSVHKNFKIIK